MNIQTRAIKLKQQLGKCKKEQVQSYIERMYEKSEREEDLEILARMYDYFTPATPKRCKTSIEWVGCAVDRSGNRPYINNIYSDGENIVATDGHRMHISETKLTAGFYDIKGNKIEIDYTFPDYKRVIPNAKEKKIININDVDIVKLGKVFAYSFMLGDIDFYFNKKNLDAALNGKKEVVFMGDFSRYNNPIMFDCEFGTVVIMGMKGLKNE